MNEVKKQSEVVPGDYGDLTRLESFQIAQLAHDINSNHKLKAGETALYWHLIHIINSHIKKD
jgi:hypothetical protein